MKFGRKVREKLPKWVKGPLRRFWDKLKDIGRKNPALERIARKILDKIKSKIEEKIKKIVKDFLDDLFKDLDLPEKLKKYWEECLEWIFARDPVSTS